MNANELADELKLVRCLAGDGQVLDKAATMLRHLKVREITLCDLVKEYQDKVDDLRAENEVLREKIKHLESQVYGGSTK